MRCESSQVFSASRNLLEVLVGELGGVSTADVCLEVRTLEVHSSQPANVEEVSGETLCLGNHLGKYGCRSWQLVPHIFLPSHHVRYVTVVTASVVGSPVDIQTPGITRCF